MGYTGAVAPSSRYLAVEMVQSIRHHRLRNPGKALRILELGPGTGAITNSIVQAMHRNDTLDIVEIDKRFFDHIRTRFSRPGIQVYNLDVLKFEVSKPYDVIISSIPYEQIPAEITSKIWRKKLSMMASGGSIAYYKYYRFNHFSSDFERKINKEFCSHEKLIWRNVPPAIAYHLTVPDGRII